MTTCHIALPVEDVRGKDVRVILSNPREKKVPPPEPKCKSFQIREHHGMVQFSVAKQVHISNLYAILREKGGLSPMTPVVAQMRDNKLVYDMIEWAPVGDNITKFHHFMWNGTRCTITGRELTLNIRVYDTDQPDEIFADIMREFESKWIPLSGDLMTINITARNGQGQYKWTQLQNIHGRDPETVFLRPGLMEQLTGEIERYMSPTAVAMYRKFSMPRKLVVLLYGPPGTGKTSTIISLASAHKKSLCKITLDPHMTSAELELLLSQVPKASSWIVIEDFDRVLTGAQVDMSTVLNLFDGISSPETVIFVTANDVEVLRKTDALMRVGRIDVNVKFDPPTRAELARVLATHGADYSSEHEAFLDTYCADNNMPIATLRKHLFLCAYGKLPSIMNFECEKPIA